MFYCLVCFHLLVLQRSIAVILKTDLEIQQEYWWGGHKDCYRENKRDSKRDLDATIGRNPVTGKVTSKAELLGGNKATNNLEKAQMNYGNKKYELEKAEELYQSNPSTKNSNRLEKARKAFKKAQIDLKGAEEIKAKADMKKAK